MIKKLLVLPIVLMVMVVWIGTTVTASHTIVFSPQPGSPDIQLKASGGAYCNVYYSVSAWQLRSGGGFVQQLNIATHRIQFELGYELRAPGWLDLASISIRVWAPDGSHVEDQGVTTDQNLLTGTLRTSAILVGNIGAGQSYIFDVICIGSDVGVTTVKGVASFYVEHCGGPANNCFANSISVATPSSTTVTTTGATTQLGEPAPCGLIGATVWYSFTARTSGTATIDTVGGSTNYDTVLAAYTGSLGALTKVACNDDYSGLQSRISFACTVGTTYRIQLGGFNGATGTATLDVNGC